MLDCLELRSHIGRSIKFHNDIASTIAFYIYSTLCFINIITVQCNIENFLKPEERTTFGDLYIRRVVNGREFYSRPDMLMFTAPARLCRSCRGNNNYNLNFPLFVGSSGRKWYTQYFEEDAKQLHVDNPNLPFKHKTTNTMTYSTKCPTETTTTTTTTEEPVMTSSSTVPPEFKETITHKTTSLTTSNVKLVSQRCPSFREPCKKRKRTTQAQKLAQQDMYRDIYDQNSESYFMFK